MIKHTPGPWRVKVDGEGIETYVEIQAGEGYLEKEMTGFCFTSFASRADAALIVSAPHMLAALREIAEAAEQQADYCSDGGPNLAMKIQVIAEIAIRKAERQL